MPDKPLTVLTYAASASLAAVALVYFFNPNYLIDGDSSTSSASTRKKGIVGLFNPANDCFVNSILQALAGLGELRLYLIRELHRRELGGSDIYATVPLVDSNGKEVDGKKLASLQGGEVTKGLKSMIDQLNERPIYKKTISASNFVRVLEVAFTTKISKTQQDAQELLQIVAERLSEEYHAGREARKRMRVQTQKQEITSDNVSEVPLDDGSLKNSGPVSNHSTTNAPTDLEQAEDGREDPPIEEEDGFPLAGVTEARTECQYCHFVPKASPTSFVMLNLMVPQKSSTTLDECLDTHFKKEFIDDYVCDKCRLMHAIETFSKDLTRASTNAHKAIIQAKIAKVQEALEADPEKVPEGIDLPDTKLAPKRRIARHVEITTFPKVFVMHLSRSMFDPRSSSTKNFAKLSFPEKLAMGSLLDRRNYKLLGIVTHKGTHNNGHYETFRRQHLYAPYSTPHVDKSSGPYSTSTTPAQSKSKLPSPKLSQDRSTTPSTVELSSASNHSHSTSSSSTSRSPPSTRPSSGDIPPTPTSSKASQTPTKDPQQSQGSKSRSASIMDVSRFRRKKRPVDRWWRISDDKVKECKTAEVLSMQKEVYMLFYELEREGG